MKNIKSIIEKWDVKKLKKHETEGQMWSVSSEDLKLEIEVAAADKSEAIAKAIETASNSPYVLSRLGIESE